MTKRTPPCSPEVRGRAVRMVPDHQGEPGWQNAAIRSIAAMIAFIDAQRADPGRRSARARHDDDRRVGSRGVVEENVQAHGAPGPASARPRGEQGGPPHDPQQGAVPAGPGQPPQAPPNARWAADLTAACPRAGKPDPGDNALAETLHGLHKTGVIGQEGPWRSVGAVELAILEGVDGFNNRRLLEPLGNMPPAAVEARYQAQAERPSRRDPDQTAPGILGAVQQDQRRAWR
jgi:hypothetical protein